jgi:hypothetical protein
MVVRLLKDTSWKEMIHSLLDIVLYEIEGRNDCKSCTTSRSFMLLASMDK